jgi:hypothetical protein
VLLGLKGQEKVYPFDEEEAESGREISEAGAKEIPVDSIEYAATPAVMAFEVGSLSQRRIEVANLGGNVVCQGATLHREGNKAGGEEWYQRSGMRQSLEFRRGQFIASDIQLGWPGKILGWKGVVLVAFDVFEVRLCGQ